ncbi:uncharacterized protein [Gossypium hirsutum]|uniref:Uncharacterized protein isoform X2 n=1 Tax=Gossypium hirsutum TaxID=3635 RepID=A0ABM2YXH5_GOSHI|nr:uncharacterized protein LOC107897734 isoform X2 [Gossypium hirsutum]
MTNQASFTIFIFLPLNLLIYAAVVFAALKLASRHCRLQLPLSASSSGLRHLTNCKYYWTYRQVCCLPKRLKKLRLDLLCTWSAGICYCFLFLFGLFDCFLHLELSILYSLNHLMAHLPLIVQSERRKRIDLTITMWLQMCTVASWFLVALGAIHSLHTYRPNIRSYILDFYAKRDYVKRLVYASDETCIEQVRMNRITFFKLCEMLQTLGGLRSSRNMLVDEQVAMFLHIISHHFKNRVIKHHFNMSGETVSRSFHNVLNAIIRLQNMLFKKAKPITPNSTGPRWKWF